MYIYAINLWATTVSLFESSSSQLRSNEHEKKVHHVPKSMSYHGAIGGLAIKGKAHCLSFLLHIYIYIYIYIYISSNSEAI